MEPWLVILLVVVASVIALIVLIYFVMFLLNDTIVGDLIELIRGAATNGMSDYAWDRKKVQVEKRLLANRELPAVDLAELA